MSDLHPAVSSWITDTFKELNEVQRASIPQISNRESTLVMSPTGTGKTLSAFLGILSELYKLGEDEKLEKKIYCIYISPLKALGNDIHKNLEIPLEGIQSSTNVKIGKRTGDTPTAERAKLLRSPPHILITTPESFALMLASPKFKENFKHVEWVIIDEIHSLADNKRGTMLSVDLERLQAYIGHDVCRIGLSATIDPPEVIAHYLIGNRSTPIFLIDFGRKRDLEIEVVLPVSQIDHVPYNILHKEHVKLIKRYVSEHITTLIFSNTRHLSERMVYELREAFDGKIDDEIGVHHGSLDKKLRLDVEEQLKAGKMKAVFTSTSLEMGIDIGSIDLTVQLGSSKSVRALLQRVGRAGHQANALSRGKILVFSRDDLIENLAITKLALNGRIDPIRIPQQPKDVLFQILVGMSLEKKWNLEDAYKVIIKSYPYRNLEFESFKEMVKSVSNPTDDENGWKYSNLWFDPDADIFGKRRRTRQAYMQNVGTIPSIAMVDVVLEGYRTRIGQVSENFSEKLSSNDVFILNARTFKFLRSAGNRIIVREVHGEIPTVPSWVGEGLSRTWLISEEISRIYSVLEDMISENKIDEATNWLSENYSIAKEGAEHVVDYLYTQMSISTLPKIDRIVIEKYKDPTGALNILVLSLFGKETNAILSQALARILTNELQVNIASTSTDNGFLIRLPTGKEINHYDLFTRLKEDNLEEIMIAGLRGTELFRNRFRYALTRSLLILQKFGKSTTSVTQQQKLARWLIKSLPDEFPLVDETFREILYDTMNFEKAYFVVHSIRNGSIQIEAVPENDLPSPMTHNILLNDNIELFFIEDRRALMLSLHHQVLSRLVPVEKINTPIFDQESVTTYYETKLQSLKPEHQLVNLFMVPRLSEEILSIAEKLHLNMEEITGNEELMELNGHYLHRNAVPFYLSYQSKKTFKEVVPKDIQELSDRISPEDGLRELIQQFLQFEGPKTISQITKQLQSRKELTHKLLVQLQQEGIVLVGNFYSSHQQYILQEDRDNYFRSVHETDEIQLDEDTLKRYNIQAHGLQGLSKKIDEELLLQEYGPMRDPIGLWGRLDKFSMPKLRVLLQKREVLYGKFFGHRLCFVHRTHIPLFIAVYRTIKHLDTISETILEAIRSYPGITVKDLKLRLNIPNVQILQALNLLEEHIFISRVGLFQPISHSRDNYTRYVEIIPDYQEDPDEAIIKFIELCSSWFGLLSIHDLLRITRLDYDQIEMAISKVNLNTVSIYSTLYYGREHHIENLRNHSDPPSSLLILNPNDPYFFAHGAAYNRHQTPRMTQLRILYNGNICGNLDISLQNTDLFQVLNIQIYSKYRRDLVLIQEIGLKIISLANSVFHSRVVLVEEINFHPVNSDKNQYIVFGLQEIGYDDRNDYLLAGLGKSTNFTLNDIQETRQLNVRDQLEKSFTDLELLFQSYPVLTVSETLNRLNQKSEEEKRLLLSNYSRQGKIHFSKGKFYANSMWSFIEHEGHQEELPNIEYPTTLSTLLKSGFNFDAVENLVKNDRLELISPFSRVQEFRPVETQTGHIPLDELTIYVNSIIRKIGPISYEDLLAEVKSLLSVSSTEVLYALATLVETHRVFSSMIDNSSNTRSLIYYTKEQLEILKDQSRKDRFKRWEIVSNNSSIFPVDQKFTHLVLHKGSLLVSFKLKRKVDVALIEEIEMYDELEKYDFDLLLPELISEMETLLFSQGYKKLQIMKIMGAIPKYWLEIQ